MYKILSVPRLRILIAWCRNSHDHDYISGIVHLQLLDLLHLSFSNVFSSPPLTPAIFEAYYSPTSRPFPFLPSHLRDIGIDNYYSAPFHLLVALQQISSAWSCEFTKQYYFQWRFPSRHKASLQNLQRIPHSSVWAEPSKTSVNDFPIWAAQQAQWDECMPPLLLLIAKWWSW